MPDLRLAKAGTPAKAKADPASQRLRTSPRSSPLLDPPSASPSLALSSRPSPTLLSLQHTRRPPPPTPLTTPAPPAQRSHLLPPHLQAISSRDSHHAHAAPAPRPPSSARRPPHMPSPS
jgi:hypothetical protein